MNELKSRVGLGLMWRVGSKKQHLQRFNLQKHFRLLIIAWYVTHGKTFVMREASRTLSRFIIESSLFLSLVKFLFINSHNFAQSKFKLSWWKILARAMENIKQLMSDVDAYMTKLIESIELIETADFPHSEGQFFIRYFVCHLIVAQKNSSRSYLDQ